MTPEMKGAVMGVINNIDSDLDENGYIPSNLTDEAVEYLEQVLTGLNPEEEDSDEDNPGDEILVERPRRRATDIEEDNDVSRKV